tara:strand:- start:260 stop:817 length:558 start_codon:yes stop_codon:yes gene_type:complete
MSNPKVFIYKFDTLYKVLHELSSDLKLNFIKINNIKNNFKELQNSCIISSIKIDINENNILIDNEKPISINKILQDINTTLLRKKFLNQSNFFLGNYILNSNSRIISKNGIELKLTEREVEIIIYIYNKKKSVTIKELQSNVWKYNKDLETHTVETHVHRVKKKFKNIFKDEKFIKSTNYGYLIN